jgi:cell division protein FtsB
MVCLVDKNNLVEQFRLSNEIRELKHQRNYYIEQIKRDSIEIESLKNDTCIEKVARERYLMKRSNETIVIINEK